MHTRTTTNRTTSTRTRLGALGGLVGAAALLTAGGAPAHAGTEVERPDTFTSAYTVMATPEEVVDGDGNAVPGEPGATGTFDFMINSDEEIICYDITVEGVTPPYESPAKTATHVHEANAGEGGPPRLAFPNPEGDGDVLTSSGCLQGPFTTGLEGDDGTDTGEGFSLAEIEANPAGFSADTHTAEFVPGAVRGQLQQVPVGGVETGLGGASTAAASDQSALLLTGSLALLGLAVGGVAIRRHVRD